MIDEQIAGFIEGAVMTILASRDARMRAAIGRAVGTRRAGPSLFETLVSRVQWPELTGNLVPGAPLALTFAGLEDYRCYQVKSVVLEVGAADEDDRRRAASYVAEMTRRLAGVGVAARPAGAWLCEIDLQRVRYRPLAVYDQTPGIHAGRRLGEPVP
ncbi:hypothetical protein [Ancylobacter mangrovi]|uniref:hypothetical protein n=1 Tax=Ancylobacter mangrovi TaxID=2972472 RepID=UPI00216262AD|nr:hypothetical protein [Ancylobacter mangrovi]MCS0504117.1 hypothetical protein [Ancylobacter mangrovi]